MPLIIETPRQPKGEKGQATGVVSWMTKVALPQLEKYAASLKSHPPIRSGTPDPYEPPN